MSAYLDYAATAPLRPAALEAWLRSAQGPANPSSLHRSGRAASRILEDARELVASLAGAAPGEVVFTGGGTESDAIALQGLFRLTPRRKVLVGATEHKAVLDTVAALPGAEVVVLPVDGDAVLRLDVLAEAIDGDTALVAVMAANNEVGAVNDVGAIGRICAEAGVPWHCDAVQWPATRSLTAIGADTVAVSAHKVGGPVGVGALIVRRGTGLPVYTHGGGQEGGIRSGTVSVAGAAAFAAALAEAEGRRDAEAAGIAALRGRLEEGVREIVPDVVVSAAGADRLVSHVHAAFPGCEGDALLMLLDAAGVEVSTGAACSAGIAQPSHVVLAMGAGPAAARGSLRFSLGWASRAQDADAALEAIGPAAVRAKRAGALSGVGAR